jgi:hypothetical protein
MQRFLKLSILISAIVFVLPILATSQTADTRPDVKKIIEDIDRLYRSNSSFSDVEMTIVTPHWKRTLGMKVWTEEMEKTFIRLTSPEKEKGVATLKDYDYEYTTVDNPADNLYYIKCIPHKDLAIVWGSIVIAARKSDYIPIWEKYYDDKGNLARTLYFRDVQTFDGRRVPAVMEMVPEDKEGHSTSLKYNSLTFNIGVENDIFTLRNLRSE